MKTITGTKVSRQNVIFCMVGGCQSCGLVFKKKIPRCDFLCGRRFQALKNSKVGFSLWKRKSDDWTWSSRLRGRAVFLAAKWVQRFFFVSSVDVFNWTSDSTVRNELVIRITLKYSYLAAKQYNTYKNRSRDVINVKHAVYSHDVFRTISIFDFFAWHCVTDVLSSTFSQLTFYKITIKLISEISTKRC